jgi:hypothetical protein
LEEYLEALRKELEMTENLVLPEKFMAPNESVFDKQIQRPARKLPDVFADGGLAQYGLRHSGEGVKGKGYFGPMAGRDGTVTELSAEDESGEFPLVVPTLTAEEIELLLAGKDPTAEMMEKASSWAATRRKRGESPFASPTEVRMPRPKAEGGNVYSPRPGLVFVGQEHGAPADVPQDIRDLANQVGAFYEGSGGDKLPDIRYRGSWDDAASRSVKGYPPEYLYTIFTNTDVNKQKDALVGDGTIFNNLLKNQQQVGYFKDRRFNRKDLSNFLQSMGPEFLRDSQNPATESNVEDFLKRGEQLMWESGDTPARQLADKANESRQRWLLNQPKGVFFMGSDHVQKLKELHGAGKKAPVKKAEGGPVNLTDLPDEVTPANWREHLQNNVLADARALLGVKDGGVINLDELIEKSLKKKDGGVINLDELIDWTLAKAEHRKMKEGGAVKMQGGGNPGEVSGEMFKPKPLTIPEPITDLVEALRRQFEKEKRSMRKPGAVQDVLMRGPVAAYAGAPADIVGMGGELLDFVQKKIPALRKPASVMDTGPEKTPPMGYAPMFPLSPEGSYGTTAAQEMMGKAGLTTGEERPLFETGAMFAAPAAGYAGLKAGKALAPTAKEMLDVQLQQMMSPYQMNVIKPEGGNWVRGATQKYVEPLKRKEAGGRFSEDVLKELEERYTPEALAAMSPETRAFVEQTAFPVAQANAAINRFVDKKLAKYIQNELGTPSDSVRIQADAWAEKQQTLMADKQKQIDKVRADIEKARRERNVDPEVLTRSQARLRELQKEQDLIKNRKGLHFNIADNDVRTESARVLRAEQGLPEANTAKSRIGKLWEDTSDYTIRRGAYHEQIPFQAFEEMRDVPQPDRLARLAEINKAELEKLGGEFAVQNPEALAYSMNRGVPARTLGFEHLTDELVNALHFNDLPEYLRLTPKTLDKMSVAQAAEHVDKINAWRASQKAEVDKARAANAATVVHKEYPEQGLKWVELKLVTPEQFDLPKGFSMIEDPSRNKAGEIVKTGYRLQSPEGKLLSYGETPADAYAQHFGKEALEDALKYEGEILQHCVGGYCPDVLEGRSRIFSLRDEDGRPHATIEVEPSGYREVYKNLSNEEQTKILAMLNKWVEGIDYRASPEELQAKSEQIMAGLGYKPSEQISQIKGLQNKKPEAEFMPYIQDFVKSGDWSKVGDISHTDLTPAEALRAAGWDLSKINQKYLTKEEIEALKSQPGMKRGGRITKSDLEREYRMAFGGGVFNTDPDITDSGRIIPHNI